jgi:nitroreductase
MPFADHLDRAPVLLVLLVELAALAVIDNGLGRQSIAGGGSIYPFGHNILLAARDLGLGGVMTTALARQEPAAKALLGVPDGYALAGLLALGHPARQVTKLRRAPVEEFTTVDHFGGPAFPSPPPGGST